MLAQDSRYKTILLLQRAFALIAGGIAVRARRPVSAAVALLICMSGVEPTVHAGFMHQSTLFSDGSFRVTPWRTVTEPRSEQSQLHWQDSITGAGAWDGETLDRSGRIPRWPNTPLATFSIASSATAELVAGASGRNLTSPTGPSAGGSTSAFGLCDSRVRLPISLLRYQLQQREFLFIPEAPLFELFHPS